MSIGGKYFAKTYTTSDADQDLLDFLKTDLDLSNMTVKKMTLISTSKFTVSINGVAFSEIYLDNAIYKLVLDTDDVIISSAKIHENGVAIFVSVIYN